jgi:exopolysaccharide biosynthesis polyprenyl glycosylphosphotransferase
MKNNASLIYNLFLVIGDFLALVLAFVGAYIIRGKLSSAPVAYPIHSKEYLLVFLSILPFWIIIFGLLGLYNQHIYERRFNELGRLLMGSFIGLLFVIFWNFVAVHPIFPAKLVPIYGFILAFVCLVIFRNLARYVRTQLFAYHIGLNHVLIVGDTATSRELVESLHDSKRSGYKIIAVVGSQQTLGKYDKVRLFPDFGEALKHTHATIHTIIQTQLYADELRNREILEYAQTRHIAYRFVPGNTELFVGNIDVELFRNSLPVIAVHQTALIGWGRIVKRLFDVISSFILIVIASPLMLVVASLIKFADGGPVFLRQRRLTRFNQEFRVFKFRTNNMTYNGLTPDEAFTKMDRPDLLKLFRDNGNFLANDPRNTKIGSFLRKTSIDELPQLFNVFRGDLSLVGPRALIPKDLAEYEKRHTILSVKSGITGLAQVSGRNNISFEERRKLDLYYVQNWNFWLDLIIITKTLRVILTSEDSDKVLN